MKLLFLFFFSILLCFPFTSAFNLNIQPYEINFEGKSNENICSNITISSRTYSGIMDIFDKWNNNPTKNIQDYNLDSRNFKINLNYDKSFNLTNNRTLEVCLNSVNSGNFYGVLLFKPENINFGIGVWIKANISNSGSFFSLTGNSIINLKNSPSLKFNILGIILVLDFIILLVLVFLVFYLKNKRGKGMKKKKVEKKK